MKINKEKHRKIMFDILKDIFVSDLWKVLAFKWWTACYFLYWLDRFSTDLDFDLILDWENVDDKVISILKKYWRAKIDKYNLKLSYWEQEVNIKIDINRKIWKNNNYEIINFYWIDLKVQDKGSIFANKLVALTERNTNRDIYDVNFFFEKGFDINDDIIIERTWKSKKELFKKIIDKLEKLWKNYKILDWLWDVLNEKQKQYIKVNLILDLINKLKFNLDFE